MEFDTNATKTSMPIAFVYTSLTHTCANNLSKKNKRKTIKQNGMYTKRAPRDINNFILALLPVSGE